MAFSQNVFVQNINAWLRREKNCASEPRRNNFQFGLGSKSLFTVLSGAVSTVEDQGRSVL